MEKRIEELKRLFLELLDEVATLKERVAVLEQNAYPVSPMFSPDRVEARDDGQEPGERLAALYQEGYHICPVAYGRLRDGECLFCVNFLEKRLQQ